MDTTDKRIGRRWPGWGGVAGLLILGCVLGGGAAFLFLWPEETLFWQIGGACAAAAALLLFLFRVFPGGAVFSRITGFALVLWGAGMVLNFRDVLSFNGWGAGGLVTLALVFGGGGLLFSKPGEHMRPATAAVFLACFCSGLAGWVASAASAGKNLTGVYDPLSKTHGVFVVASPCFVAQGGNGELSLLPEGYGGVFPEFARPSEVGRKIGPYKILGIVERGGTVSIYSGEGGKTAVLDFALVSPRPSEHGAAVVSSPL